MPERTPQRYFRKARMADSPFLVLFKCLHEILSDIGTLPCELRPSDTEEGRADFESGFCYFLSVIPALKATFMVMKLVLLL